MWSTMRTLGMYPDDLYARSIVPWLQSIGTIAIHKDQQYGAPAVRTLQRNWSQNQPMATFVPGRWPSGPELGTMPNRTLNPFNMRTNDYPERTQRLPGRSLARIPIILAAFAMARFGAAQDCSPVDVPYAENFDDADTPALPACITAETISGNAWRTVSSDTDGMEGKVANVGYTPSGSPDMNTWMFTRGVNMVAGTGYRLIFKYASSSDSNWPERMQVAYGTSNTEAGMSTVLADYPNIMMSTAQEVTINLLPTTTGVHYIGFQCYSVADMNQLYVDDIRVEAIPACDVPMDLAMGTIGTNMADFSWQPSISNPGEGYEWEVRSSGAPGSGSTGLDASGSTPAGATAASADQLASNTAYSLYIRSNCGGDEYSNWAGPIEFRTACDAVDLPYMEDFNAVTTPALPECMTMQTISGNPWTTVSAPTGYTGNVARVSYTSSDSPAMDTWLYTPGMNLTAGMQYELSYKYGNNSTDYTESMLVAFGNARSASAMTTTLADHPAIDDNTPHTHAVQFSPDADGVYYFGFKCYSIANQYYLYLDDISVVAATACSGTPDPGAVTAPATVCAGIDFELGISNEPQPGTSGLTYQWQGYTAAAGWADIADANTATVTVTQDEATWYRLIMACANGETAVSDSVEVLMSPIVDCYCNTVNFTSTVEPICNVTFAGIANDTDPEVGATPAFEEFLDDTAQVARGNTYTLSVAGNTAGNYTTYFTAFFDWDRDGTFETTVPVGSITASMCDSTIQVEVAVPADAELGTSRMRILKNYNTAPTNPCGSYSYGQAEDYLVNVSIGTGVERMELPASWQVHPNPATDVLNIPNGGAVTVHVKVYNALGKLVLEQQAATQLDVAKLAPGSYNLLVLDGRGHRLGHARFVKQ